MDIHCLKRLILAVENRGQSGKIVDIHFLGILKIKDGCPRIATHCYLEEEDPDHETLHELDFSWPARLSLLV